MAKKSKKKVLEAEVGFESGLKEETTQAVVTIVFFVIGIFLILSAFSKAGVVGMYAYSFLKKLLGAGYFLFPLVFFILGVTFWKYLRQGFPILRTLGVFIFLLSSLGLTHIAFENNGGAVGNVVSFPLLKLFDVYASVVILCALFIISLLVIFETKFTIDPFRLLLSKLFRKESKEGDNVPLKINPDGETEFAEPGPAKAPKKEEKEAEEEDEEEDEVIVNVPKKEKTTEEGEFSFAPSFRAMSKIYTPPPLSLLERDQGKPGVGDIKAYSNIIKRTLSNFGIQVEMDEITIGPSVTRYALKPAEGVKLSRIVALQNDLSLALAAHPIRIEAPIPGKSLVGIEIPNKTKATVGMATLLGSTEYQSSEKPLLMALGKGLSGKAEFANLAKMPHVLIAGTTGSGKSVTIHSLITSLLFRNSMENLKFIMIDPKRVELTLYKKIPHLLTPVITEAKKAILALKWAAKEMDRRYDILESESVRDIESYHKNVLAPAMKAAKGNEEEAKLPELMPYIVIFIDELADIMTSYPREMEASIVRLAQMSRAVGIHLVLSTQRPSVNVITGLIKANVPARIALQVSSQIDSRTILDTGGAEKLLGAGDMLFLSGEMSKPTRIQSGYITEAEVKKVVQYLADNYADEMTEELQLTNENTGASQDIFNSSFDSDEADDDLYEQAREEVIKAGKASTSYIQRKLRVGYARAARLVDILEERGVIGPADGSKPREVIDGGTSTMGSISSIDADKDLGSDSEESDEKEDYA